MLKSELLKLIESSGDDQDINETIQGIEGLIKPFDVNTMALEDFKKAIADNKELKGYYQSSLDSGISKGVSAFEKNFTENKLPKLIEDGIKAKTDEGLTEEQKQLRELQKQVETMKSEKQRAELSSKYTKTLTDKNLPTDLIDFILADNEETINTNISKFEGMMKSYVDTEVNSRMKGSYKPPKNDGDIQVLEGVEKAFFDKTGLKI